jgi:hypothetical protein
MVIEYQDLTEEGKHLFQTLLIEKSVERPADRVPVLLRESNYIQYKGDLYKVTTEFAGRMVAEYVLYTSSISESEVDERSELIAFEELTTEAKAAFKHALSWGKYTTRGETLPEQLTEYRYVNHQRDYYRLMITVGDIPVWNVSAERVPS